MKKSLITIGLFLAGLIPAGAQQITSDQDVIDCGQIVFNHPVTVEYNLKNTDTQPLTISKVYSSCGCTTARYPRKAIAPGESFSIEATYDARQMGHFEKFLCIYTGAESPLKLTFKGKVVDEIVDFTGEYPFTVGDFKTDANDIEFDDVNRGDRPMAKIHIFNATDHNLEPTALHLPNYLKATVSPSTIAPNHGGELLLKLESAFIRDNGLTQTDIYLGSEPGDKVSPDKAITVSTVLLPNFEMTDAQRKMAPDMQLSANAFDLGAFKGKKKLKGSIDITNTGKSTLVISALQMFTSGIQVQLSSSTIRPGEKAQLKVTAIAKDLKQVRSIPRVLMITNDPDHSKVVLKVNVKP